MKFQRQYSKIICIFFFSIVIINPKAFAQNDVLKQQLQGKTLFKDVIQEVDAYYQSLITNNSSISISEKNKKFKEYKRWKRWEWYHSARLNDSGKISNASQKILEAIDVSANSFAQSNNNETEPELTNSGSWSNIGPFNLTTGGISYLKGIGRVDRITFHPTNAQIYYVCTPAGGLWRTTDDGVSWANLSDELPSMGISGMVINHADPNILYILTGDGDSNIGGFVENFGYIRWSQGVFKSFDGGNTWQRSGTFPGVAAQYTGFKLIQSPTDANALLAATSSGIYRTFNGGATWENAGPISMTNAVFYDVEFNANGDNVYAVAKVVEGSYFLKATSTLQFTRIITTGIPSNNSLFTNNAVTRYAIGVSDANPQLVVLFAGASISNTGFQGVYTSIDNGISFTAKANTPNILGGAVNGLSEGDQAEYDHCVAVAHNNSQKIITGGLCVWRSDNGGTSFSAKSKYFETTVGTMGYIHPDVHDVAYNPLNNNLYACTDGGVYKSVDNGDTWTNLSAGLIITQYYHLAGIDNDVNKLLGGTQDNGSMYRKTNSNVFTHIRGADGHRTAINSTNANTIYWTENENIYRSNDAATANINGIIPVTPNVFYPAFRLNPSNQLKVYIGTGHKASGSQKFVFYHSDDGGFTYIDSTTINVTKDIACAPSDVNVLYGTDGNNIWRSQNEGYSFQLRVTGLPASRVITSLTVNPNNAAIVVATLGGFTANQKVYFTSDGGVNWQNLSGTLPNVPVTSSAINTNGDVYIGTDIGVFYQADAESDWRPFYNGLPRVPVTELIIYPNNDLIRAATFGRGIWQTSLFTSCASTGVYTAAVGNPSVYNNGSTIQTSQTILGSAGVNVLYKAGSFITLSPGFIATQNSVMNAIIGPCTTGIYSGTMLRNNKVSGAIKSPPLSGEQTKKTGTKQSYF